MVVPVVRVNATLISSPSSSTAAIRLLCVLLVALSTLCRFDFKNVAFDLIIGIRRFPSYCLQLSYITSKGGKLLSRVNGSKQGLVDKSARV